MKAPEDVRDHGSPRDLVERVEGSPEWPSLGADPTRWAFRSGLERFHDRRLLAIKDSAEARAGRARESEGDRAATASSSPVRLCGDAGGGFAVNPPAPSQPEVDR